MSWAAAILTKKYSLNKSQRLRIYLVHHLGCQMTSQSHGCGQIGVNNCMPFVGVPLQRTLLLTNGAKDTSIIHQDIDISSSEFAAEIGAFFAFAQVADVAFALRATHVSAIGFYFAQLVFRARAADQMNFGSFACKCCCNSSPSAVTGAWRRKGRTK